MKHKVGQVVIVRNLPWYIGNADDTGSIRCNEYTFIKAMSKLCGMKCTIKTVDEQYHCYDLVEDTDQLSWTDEMFQD